MKGIWSDALGRAAIRSLQLIAIGLLLAATASVLLELKLVVVPGLLAVVVAATVAPLVHLLRARQVPRFLAVLIVMLSGSLVFFAMGWIIAKRAAGQWDELRRGALDGLVELRALVVRIVPVEESRLESWGESLVDQLGSAEIRSRALSGAGVAAEVVVSFLLFVVILFFLLKDGDRIQDFLLRMVSRSERDRAKRIADCSSLALGRFVRGTAVVAAVDAIIIGISLAVLGVPLAFALALVVFVGAFIPIIGATAAGSIAALIALVSNGPIVALVVVAIVLFVNQLEGNLLAPVVLGKAVNLHPLVVLLAITVGTIIAGVIGALLSIPLVAVAWTAIREWNEPAEAQ